jgi:hypothetical protein
MRRDILYVLRVTSRDKSKKIEKRIIKQCVQFI